jgi:ribosomal protein L24
MPARNLQISVDDQVFLVEGGEEIGAVQQVAKDHLVIYIENAGPFTVTGAQVKSAHDGKVVLDMEALDAKLLAAAQAAHSSEE